jgi:ribonuclease BN (tRNA processing enzyme)
MQLTVIGCGDAFGSGGRLQSAYLIEVAGRSILLDCGASTMIGINRLGIDANAIDTVLISHLHGDHFPGLVWMTLAGQFSTKRTAPLRVIGPPSIAQRYEAAAEVLFPGMTKVKRAFELAFVEITAGTPYADADLKVDAFEVSHPSGAPSYALRITAGGRTLAFSGDTEWVGALAGCAAGADLFITECCAVDRPIKYHLNWRTIEQNLAQLTARRIMLTHMNADMLAFAPSIRSDSILIAEDGLKIRV